MLLGIVLQAFAQEPNYLILVSFLGGFAGGGFWPVLLSMIGDIAKPEEQHEAISTFYFFSSIGMFLGPIICSFLLMFPQVALRNIYQIGAVAQMIILLYFVFQVRETKPRVFKKTTNYRLYITDLIKTTSFQGLLSMSFLYFFSMSIVQTYIPIYARVELNLSNAEIISFSVYRSLAILIIRLSSATFLARLPIRPFLISVILIGGITTLVSSLVSNYLLIVLILFLSGVSYGATAILGNILVSKISTGENRGVANSLYNLSQSTGNITKLLTPPIADILGLTSVFIVGGVCGLIAVIPPLLRKVEPPS